MARTVKLGVLRGRHDTSRTPIPDSVCREVLFTNAAAKAVFQFWTTNTYDYLDLSTSVLLPWVDFQMTFERADVRKILAQHIVDLTDAAGADLDSYDGFVVLIFPGGQVTVPNPRAGEAGQAATVTRNIDAGASGLDNGKGVAVLPVMISNHTFMCHEVGHVLGLSHTYGVLNNGIEWDGRPPWDEGTVYGDPYDIMSSASFGTRNRDPAVAQWTGRPTFAGPSVAGWPSAAAFGSMGCAPARAHLHFWDEGALPGNRVQVIDLPTGSQSISRRIYRASGSDDRTILLVVRASSEGSDKVGRCYVEFRDTQGWDAGLDTAGNDLARRGVVVHAIANTTDEGPRCWYRGRILVPVETDPDLSPPDLPLTVTVTAVDPAFEYVEVALTATTERSFNLTQYVRDDPAGVSGEEVVETIPCGRVRTGTYYLQRVSTFEARAYGYGGAGEGTTPAAPIITWVVGMTPVPVGAGSLSIKTDDQRNVNVKYELDAIRQTLILTAQPSDGAYEVTVTASASEADGSSRMTATERFRPIGVYTGINKLDKALLDECMQRIVRRLRLRPRDLLIPPHPDPMRDLENNRINRARVERVAVMLGETDRGAAISLRRMADLRFGPEVR